MLVTFAEFSGILRPPKGDSDVGRRTNSHLERENWTKWKFSIGINTVSNRGRTFCEGERSQISLMFFGVSLQTLVWNVCINDPSRFFGGFFASYPVPFIPTENLHHEFNFPWKVKKVVYPSILACALYCPYLATLDCIRQRWRMKPVIWNQYSASRSIKVVLKSRAGSKRNE